MFNSSKAFFICNALSYRHTCLTYKQTLEKNKKTLLSLIHSLIYSGDSHVELGNSFFYISHRSWISRIFRRGSYVFRDSQNTFLYLLDFISHISCYASRARQKPAAIINYHDKGQTIGPFLKFRYFYLPKNLLQLIWYHCDTELFLPINTHHHELPINYISSWKIYSF